MVRVEGKCDPASRCLGTRARAQQIFQRNLRYGYQSEATRASQQWTCLTSLSHPEVYFESRRPGTVGGTTSLGRVKGAVQAMLVYREERPRVG